jgi:hypothetical protein
MLALISNTDNPQRPIYDTLAHVSASDGGLAGRAVGGGAAGGGRDSGAGAQRLFLHWPAARDAANLSLPRLHRRRRGLPAQRAEPARARRLLQLSPAAEPHQLAGVLELADFSWIRANHTGAAFLALEAATGPACPDALALAVTATALLTCLLTLLCVSLLARRGGLRTLLGLSAAGKTDPVQRLLNQVPINNIIIIWLDTADSLTHKLCSV